MNTSYSLIHQFFIGFLLWAFIILYPMLISIYVFLPLFIGVIGYLFMVGLEHGKWHYIALSLIYFINLEVNLSLPLFLMILTSLVVYAMFYKKLSQIKRCKICAKMMLVLFLDIIYLVSLLGYDFIFQTTSVTLDVILSYSLLIDLLVVTIL